MGEPINPASLPKPVGYSYAIGAEGRRVIHFAGHTARDEEGNLVGENDMVKQFEQVLKNLSATAEEASISMTDIVKLTLFVTDAEAYRSNSTAIGKIYERFFGEYFPAMTLVEIGRLWDLDLLIEIEAVAVAD